MSTARPRKGRAGAAFGKAGAVADTQTPPDTPPEGDALRSPAQETTWSPSDSQAAEGAGLRLVESAQERPQPVTPASEPQSALPAEAPNTPVTGSPAAGIPATASSPPEVVQTEAAPAITLAQPQLPDPAAGDVNMMTRTNDAVPAQLAKRVQRQQNTRRGIVTATIIAMAVTKAHEDGVLPSLAVSYRNRGGVATMFGTHRVSKQSRSAPPVRLNYNPTVAEFNGYASLATQLGISRAVLISLSLAHYYGLKDPVAIV